MTALRKPPCHFDVAAAREELARIDAEFDRCLTTANNSFHAARALINKALAAIDAGWPDPVSVPSARAIIGRVRDVMKAEPGITAAGVIEEFEREANRLSLRKPVTITDAVVEEAAVRAWSAPDDAGCVNSRESWKTTSGKAERYRNEARAVLEYAASIGGVVRAAHPLDVVPMPVIGRSIADEIRAAYPHYPGDTGPQEPAGKSTADRLTAYRCAFIIRGCSCDMAEKKAHAMLSAERAPDRG